MITADQLLSLLGGIVIIAPLCLVFILGVMLLTPGIQVSVYAIPVWLLVMYGCYRLKRQPAVRSSASAALVD